MGQALNGNETLVALGSTSDAASTSVSTTGSVIAWLRGLFNSQTFTPVTAQSVSVAATSTQSAVVNASTNKVILSAAGNDVWYVTGSNPTATVAGAGMIYLADGASSVPISVTGGTTKIAVIASVAGGHLNVAEYQ